jgi:hypothetical protein
VTGEIRIYVEGGGDDKDSKQRLRRAIDTFLKDLKEQARNKRVKWHTVACGTRRKAYDGYRCGARDHPEAFIVLLVDSEEQVVSPEWIHLKNRDRWTLTQDDKDHCFLMVRLMEAWLLADMDAVEGYYGQGFRRITIPFGGVEGIEKEDVLGFLKDATRDTQKRDYHKARHGPELLEIVDSSKVRAAAPHCERLFSSLETLISSS